MKKIYVYIATLTFLSFFIAAQNQDKAVEKTNKDLIIFSHQLHIEMETECETCHQGAAESTELGTSFLPTMDMCGECHDVENEDECASCHYEDVLEPFEVESEEAELYFSHSMHVQSNEMKCIDCHKGLDKVDYAFESPTSEPSMALCNNCHNNISVAANNCETCHISTANLTPENHQVVDFFKNHKFADFNGNKDCAVCHDNNFCEACHTATTMITETNTASDFYTPYSPHKLKNDGKEQQITLVHDLNFRYTHGIEARTQSSQCQTCHQPETFCVECHGGAGEDYAMGGIVPMSHTVQGFTTIGVGTGGGQHAIDARRDMESCVSCHDIEGNDPTCIMCHVDPDGIKGTNPKTHESNFMHNNEHGDWHDDQGSVCFNCHNNTRMAGAGFCGYCHGSN